MGKRRKRPSSAARRPARPTRPTPPRKTPRRAPPPRRTARRTARRPPRKSTPEFITTRTVIRGRGGRFVRRRFGRPETWQVYHRVDGKIDVLPLGPVGVIQKSTMVLTTGPMQGLINWSLSQTNIFTTINRVKPKRMIVTVTGQTRTKVKGQWREKHKRIKLLLNIEGIYTKKRRQRIGEYLVKAVVLALRQRGLRTQYSLEVVPWDQVSKRADDREVKKGLAYAVSRRLSASLIELHRAKITVRLER